MKNTIKNWLFTILKDYPEKEVDGIYKNYIDDKVGFNYLKNEYKNNKSNFEEQLLKDIKKMKDIEKEQLLDNPLILRPPKL